MKAAKTSRQADSEGLRARKRRETKQRIARAGLRMFLANGYEATTLEMIAAAADISRRTFFHYFTSKEEVLTAWEYDLDDVFRAAIAAQPTDASAVDVMHAALLSVVSHYETTQAIAIDRMVRSSETLRARKWGNYERQERTVFFPALAKRWPGAKQARALRAVSMLGAGALRLSVEHWGESHYRGSLAKCLNAIFGNLVVSFSAREVSDAGRAVKRARASSAAKRPGRRIRRG